jgi:hypothetical protein
MDQRGIGCGVCASNHRTFGAAARPSTPVVACSGTFAKDSSHLELAKAFDSKNVNFTDVEANDGSKVPASVLFPNDPKRRLEVSQRAGPPGRRRFPGRHHRLLIRGVGQIFLFPASPFALLTQQFLKTTPSIASVRWLFVLR